MHGISDGLYHCHLNSMKTISLLAHGHCLQYPASVFACLCIMEASGSGNSCFYKALLSSWCHIFMSQWWNMYKTCHTSPRQKQNHVSRFLFCTVQTATKKAKTKQLVEYTTHFMPIKVSSNFASVWAALALLVQKHHLSVLLQQTLYFQSWILGSLLLVTLIFRLLLFISQQAYIIKIYDIKMK